MNTEIKALHFTMNDDAKEYLNKKLERIHNAEQMIVDLIISIKKEKDFYAEATVNFRWGVSVHVQENDFDLSTAIDKMMDKLAGKITKEKEKVKDKRPGDKLEMRD
ncbi:MAG: ribosome-associated translation inhibitor RaiA [Treponema sp.]|nr:ribosome-associated translation inhibitor RaiA [Treponema sp.]